jgi:hypothetical protein
MKINKKKRRKGGRGGHKGHDFGGTGSPGDALDPPLFSNSPIVLSLLAVR